MNAQLSEREFTSTELLISVIAELLRGVRHVAVGAASPIPGSAALMARASACLRTVAEPRGRKQTMRCA